MMNLLANVAPHTGGQALFSALPATPLPNVVANMTAFGEMLRAQVTIVQMPVDEVVVEGQESRTETEFAADDSADHTEDHDHRDLLVDDQLFSLLPSLAPSVAPAPVPVAIATDIAAVSAATGESDLSAVSVVTGTAATADVPAVPVVIAPGAIATAPARPDTAPAAVAVASGIPSDSTLAFERGRAALRAVVSAPISTTTVADGPVAAAPVASAAAGLTANSAPAAVLTVRSGMQEAGSGAADRSMTVLASQAQNFLSTHSLAAPPVIGGEPLAANATSQQGVAARPQLATLLGEQLHVQINQRSEHAVIRLDPPSMGTIEIVIRHEAGMVQVQMRASNGEVARQLQAIGDTLRQDLVHRQHGDVSVQVSDSSRDADGRQRQRQAALWQDEPGRALHEEGEGRESAAFALNAE